MFNSYSPKLNDKSFSIGISKKLPARSNNLAYMVAPEIDVGNINISNDWQKPEKYISGYPIGDGIGAHKIQFEAEDYIIGSKNMLITNVFDEYGNPLFYKMEIQGVKASSISILNNDPIVDGYYIKYNENNATIYHNLYKDIPYIVKYEDLTGRIISMSLNFDTVLKEAVSKNVLEEDTYFIDEDKNIFILADCKIVDDAIRTPYNIKYNVEADIIRIINSNNPVEVNIAMICANNSDNNLKCIINAFEKYVGVFPNYISFNNPLSKKDRLHTDYWILDLYDNGGGMYTISEKDLSNLDIIIITGNGNLDLSLENLRLTNFLNSGKKIIIDNASDVDPLSINFGGEDPIICAQMIRLQNIGAGDFEEEIDEYLNKLYIIGEDRGADLYNISQHSINIESSFISLPYRLTVEDVGADIVEGSIKIYLKEYIDGEQFFPAVEKTCGTSTENDFTIDYTTSTISQNSPDDYNLIIEYETRTNNIISNLNPLSAAISRRHIIQNTVILDEFMNGGKLLFSTCALLRAFQSQNEIAQKFMANLIFNFIENIHVSTPIMYDKLYHISQLFDVEYRPEGYVQDIDEDDYPIAKKVIAKSVGQYVQYYTGIKHIFGDYKLNILDENNKPISSEIIDETFGISENMIYYSQLYIYTKNDIKNFGFREFTEYSNPALFANTIESVMTIKVHGRASWNSINHIITTSHLPKYNNVGRLVELLPDVLPLDSEYIEIVSSDKNINILIYNTLTNEYYYNNDGAIIPYSMLNENIIIQIYNRYYSIVSSNKKFVVIEDKIADDIVSISKHFNTNECWYPKIKNLDICLNGENGSKLYYDIPEYHSQIFSDGMPYMTIENESAKFIDNYTIQVEHFPLLIDNNLSIKRYKNTTDIEFMRLDKVENNIYTIPNFENSEILYMPVPIIYIYDGKQYIALSSNEYDIDYRNCNITMKSNMLDMLYISCKILDVETLNIKDNASKSDNGIIGLENKITFTEDIRVSYKYMEDSYEYRGYYDEGKRIFFHLDLNPLRGHEYTSICIEGDKIVYKEVPSYSLLGKTIYLYLLPSKIVNGTNITQNRNTVRHTFDREEMELLSSSVKGLIPLGSIKLVNNYDLYDVSILDTRKLGGGIKENVDFSEILNIDSTANNFWDISSLDGIKYYPNGFMVINIPKQVLKENGGVYDKKDIEEIVNNHKALGIRATIKYYDYDIVSKVEDEISEDYEYIIVGSNDPDVYIESSSDPDEIIISE